ncbi:MAG: hypothetical protein RL562_883 [Planctomycetota bacterium]
MPSTQAKSPVRSDARGWVVQTLLLAALVVWVRARTFDGWFTGDDFLFGLVGKTFGTVGLGLSTEFFFWTPWPDEIPLKLYRPLTMLLWTADQSVHGLSYAGAATQNALWHLACLCAVRALAIQLGLRTGLATAAAAILALGPAFPEIDHWLSCRLSLVSATFVAASLACFARWQRGGPHAFYALSVLGFAVALFAKEAGLSAPAGIAVLALLVPGRGNAAARRFVRAALCTVPYALAIASYILLRSHVLGDTVGGYQVGQDTIWLRDPWSHSLDQLRMALMPLHRGIWSDTAVLAAGVGHAAVWLLGASLAVQAEAGSVTRRVFGFGLAWIAIASIPNLLAPTPTAELYHGRLFFHPGIGAALCLAATVRETIVRFGQRAGLLLLGTILTAEAAMLWRNAHPWVEAAHATATAQDQLQRWVGDGRKRLVLDFRRVHDGAWMGQGPAIQFGPAFAPPDTAGRTQHLFDTDWRDALRRLAVGDAEAWRFEVATGALEPVEPPPTPFPHAFGGARVLQARCGRTHIRAGERLPVQAWVEGREDAALRVAVLQGAAVVAEVPFPSGPEPFVETLVDLRTAPGTYGVELRGDGAPIQLGTVEVLPPRGWTTW